MIGRILQIIISIDKIILITHTSHIIFQTHCTMDLLLWYADNTELNNSKSTRLNFDFDKSTFLWKSSFKIIYTIYNIKTKRFSFEEKNL